MIYTYLEEGPDGVRDGDCVGNRIGFSAGVPASRILLQRC